MEVISRLILQVHKKTHDLCSKHNIPPASTFTVERLRQSCGGNTTGFASGFCDVHATAHQARLEITNTGSPDGLANLGSICSYPDSVLQGWSALRGRCELPG